MLRIGPFTLDPFCQAGLAGYSDRAMRVVARRRGCGFALTEALSDEHVALGGNAVRRRLAVGDDDHPLAGQLMGSEPEMMARAARELVVLGHDVVDVNVACPVRKQARPRGGHLLADPERAIAILGAVRDAVPAHVPTTLKLRRGTDDDPAAAERFHRILAAAFDAGYAAACVHGRTVRQAYRGRSSWEFLAGLPAAFPGRTLLGSGDVFSPEDAVGLLARSGMDGVWIARGAIGNPWIFAEAAALARGEAVPAPPTIARQREAIEEHLALARPLYETAALVTRTRALIMRYARVHPDGARVRQAAIAARSPAAVDALIAGFYTADGPGVRPPPESIDEVNAKAGCAAT